MLEAMVIRSWGNLDPVTGLLDWGLEISRAAERLVHARAEVASGLFKPNRENDELMYTLENPEHGRRTRGYGAVPWYHSFPTDQGTYRSHHRKEEEAEWIRKLEEFVHSSKERERSREEWLQDEIKRQVQAAISSLTIGGYIITAGRHQH